MDYREDFGANKMNRKDWEFEYTAEELANAAELKRMHRQSRVEWWEKEQAKVMSEVKESGLEIQESMAQAYTSNAGSAPLLSVKPELQKKLQECHTRIQKHMEAVREYEGWVQVLTAQFATSNLKLTHADWLFFFGKD